MSSNEKGLSMGCVSAAAGVHDEASEAGFGPCVYIEAYCDDDGMKFGYAWMTLDAAEQHARKVLDLVAQERARNVSEQDLARAQQAERAAKLDVDLAGEALVNVLVPTRAHEQRYRDAVQEWSAARQHLYALQDIFCAAQEES